MTRLIVPIIALFIVTACGTQAPSSVRYGQEAQISPAAGGQAFYSIAEPLQCVPYAREKSGIQIFGNAHTWWNQAKGRYERGHTPKVGAVFVLSKAGKLNYGHLSVVKRVVDSRTIEVAHSNWGNNRQRRSIVYNRMPVQDLSKRNDWSRVRFWNYELDTWGLPYQASGFIYPDSEDDLDRSFVVSSL